METKALRIYYDCSEFLGWLHIGIYLNVCGILATLYLFFLAFVVNKTIIF